MSKKRYLTWVVGGFSIYSSSVCADNVSVNNQKDDKKQLKIGNLALPVSQQPASLFSIGQNMIEKGDLLVEGVLTQQKGRYQSFIDISGSVLYGVTDNFTLLGGIPFALSFRQANCKTSGIGDLFLGGEYAFYNKEKYTSTDQVTFLATLYVPTGSFSRKPSIGLGTVSFLTGITASHISIDWYCYLSLGGFFVSRNRESAFTHQVLYEAGFGRNIKHLKGMIFLVMVDFNGSYSNTKNRRMNSITSIIATNARLTPKNTSNVIFIGPSLFVSTERMIMQAGIQFPVLQQSLDKEVKNSYRLAVLMSWKF
jgi:hypothetical protein